MSTETLSSFKNKISGKIVDKNNDEYESLRTVYNGMISKLPEMIVVCSMVEDVQSCVNFASENKMLVAIRGGGHNAGGLGICDGGLVIDLSGMKTIDVNENAKTVRAKVVFC